MAQLTRDAIEAGFKRIETYRYLDHNRARFLDPDFWRALNPHLSIRDCPFAAPPTISIDRDEAQSQADRLRTDGYLSTQPLVTADLRERMARGIQTLAAAGIPTALASIYDEYYQIFEGLESLFSPILGEQYRWLGNGNYAFHVPAGDPGTSGLTAGGPHRDSLGPDPGVLARGLPTIVTVWVPLNDVSPLESCLYAVPADLDPDYFTSSRVVDRDRFGLQSVRAIPASAGSVLAWSTHLIHWGSAASRHARHPRMSVVMYFQRRDVAPYDATSVFNVGDDVPCQRRLRWAASSLGRPGLFD